MMALDEYSVVAMAIQKMDNKLEKLQDEIVDIGKVLSKQDVILEKMVNLESNTTENSKRIHSRIDEIEKRVDEMHDFHHKSGCPIHRQFISQRTEQVKSFEKITNDISTRLEKIEGKGSKRWEMFIGEIIKFAVVIVAGLVALKLGVKV